MEENKNVKKLSYEELENIAAQFQQRVIGLENQLRGINVTSIRLNYLFKVVENKDVFPKRFIDKCVEEIVDTLTIEEQPNTDAPESTK